MREPVRTLVVWCLDWPVLAAEQATSPDVPVAVVFANRVVACSAAARYHGVARGQRRREAQSRCPMLCVVERDEAREARLFEPIAAVCERFTPRIEIARPGTCTFATRGPSRYFGGDEALAHEVGQAVTAALGGRTECRIGVADGPFAAHLAARSARADQPCVVAAGASAAFLAPLPVSTLERAELTSVLLRLGVTTLGQLAAFPLADVVGRFGSMGEWAHRVASGRDDRLPDARQPPPELRVAIEIEPPAERIEQVAFAARALAEELHARLDERGLACTRIAIEVESEHGERHSRLWRHEGALSAGALADRVRWQLDGWLNAAAAQRPSGGLIHLELVPDEIVPARGRQLGFWGGETEADERARRALARAQVLLGPESVLVPERRGGRGPAEQIALVPAQSVDLADRARSRPGEAAPWPGRLPPPAPAIIYDSDVTPSIELVDGHGKPVSVDGRGLLSAPPQRAGRAGRWEEVAQWAGPWPADERWWDDRRRQRRARLQVVLASGIAHLVVRQDNRWSIEATYD